MANSLSILFIFFTVLSIVTTLFWGTFPRLGVCSSTLSILGVYNVYDMNHNFLPAKLSHKNHEMLNIVHFDIGTEKMTWYNQLKAATIRQFFLLQTTKACLEI